MSGGPRRGRTRQAEAWYDLRAHGPSTIGEVVKRTGWATKVASSRLRDLRAAGCVTVSGDRMHMLYTAVGDGPPMDKRGGGRAREAKIKAHRKNSCGGIAYMVQSRREGTPGEIPPIPRMVDLLMPH
jgi:hypothetical protein